MGLIKDILPYRSVAVVGLEKNTGKTEALNFLLRRYPSTRTLAVTSIGTDGERTDSLTGGRKPEITLRAGMIFGTAEKYYRRRRLVAELLDITAERSAMGRILTARALSDGKVMLSGPVSSEGLQRWVQSVERQADVVFIDGALSRRSSASPAVCEAMILSTGAALSANADTLVAQTLHVVDLIDLPLADEGIAGALHDLTQGVWVIDEAGVRRLELGATLLSGDVPLEILRDRRAIYLSGALTDRFLQRAITAGVEEIVVRNFTKIFVPARTLKVFTAKGGRLTVLEKSKLAALTVNPVAPNGMVLRSEMLRERLAAATGLPVYDVMEEN